MHARRQWQRACIAPTCACETRQRNECCRTAQPVQEQELRSADRPEPLDSSGSRTDRRSREPVAEKRVGGLLLKRARCCRLTAQASPEKFERRGQKRVWFPLCSLDGKSTGHLKSIFLTTRLSPDDNRVHTTSVIRSQCHQAIPKVQQRTEQRPTRNTARRRSTHLALAIQARTHCKFPAELVLLY
jgi:hypothetical protein